MLHVALDADSSEIIAHTTTDQDAGDASQVEPLLNQIDGRIGQFTADGAYDGKPTNDAVTDQGILLECLWRDNQHDTFVPTAT